MTKKPSKTLLTIVIVSTATFLGCGTGEFITDESLRNESSEISERNYTKIANEVEERMNQLSGQTSLEDLTRMIERFESTSFQCSGAVLHRSHEINNQIVSSTITAQERDILTDRLDKVMEQLLSKYPEPKEIATQDETHWTEDGQPYVLRHRIFE